MEAASIARAVASFVRREKEVLLGFLATRLLLWLLGWFSFQWFVHTSSDLPPGTGLWNLLARSDALWYQDIAEYGYRCVPGTEQNVSFFPLLPLCMRALKAITGAPPLLAGFVISNVALLVAAILLRRVAELDFPAPSRVPNRAVWFLLLSPMTFFHSAVYTESLFLLFSMAAFLFAMRGRWAAAGVAGALLTATRANGILILIPLLLIAAMPNDNRQSKPPSGVLASRWWLLAVPAGLAAYMTFLHIRFDDALAFWHAQITFGRVSLPPWQALSVAMKYPVPDGAFLILSAVTGLLVTVVLFLIPTRWSYRAYAAAMLVVCLSTTWYSLPRYLSAVFPFYLTLATLTSRSEAFFTGLIAANIGTMTICLALYVTGYPII